MFAQVWIADATTQNDAMVRQMESDLVDSQVVGIPPHIDSLSFESDEEAVECMDLFNAAAETSHVSSGHVEPHPPSANGEVGEHKQTSKGKLLEDSSEKSNEAQPYGWRAAKDGRTGRIYFWNI